MFIFFLSVACGQIATAIPPRPHRRRPPAPLGRPPVRPMSPQNSRPLRPTALHRRHQLPKWKWRTCGLDLWPMLMSTTGNLGFFSILDYFSLNVVII